MDSHVNIDAPPVVYLDPYGNTDASVSWRIVYRNGSLAFANSDTTIHVDANSVVNPNAEPDTQSSRVPDGGLPLVG